MLLPGNRGVNSPWLPGLVLTGLLNICVPSIIINDCNTILPVQTTGPGLSRSCDWCEEALKASSATDSSDGRVTDGLCVECAEKLTLPALGSLLDYLDSLDAPVFIAHGDARFIAANRLARTVAGGDPAEIKDWLIGDLFDCVWADSYGGCGKAECCRACLIKDSVTETMASGRAVKRKPAYLDVLTAEGVQRQHYVVSTLKAGDAVLLRIDQS